MANLKAFRNLQRQLANKVVLEDHEQIKHIAGLDGAMHDNELVIAAVVYDTETGKTVEKTQVVIEKPEPYIPTYLSLREGPGMIEAVKKLKTKPDMLIVDGHGIAHPEGCGIATFVGVSLDIPTIGIGKKMLIADIDNEDIFLMGEPRGKLVQTRKHAKPVFVSPGHKISINTAARIVKELVVPPHKLPEPLHLAHRHANNTEARQEIEGRRQAVTA